MIILDTNIVSEIMRPRPDVQVLEWLNQNDISTLHLTSVTLAELCFGLYRMPDGRRKSALIGHLDQILKDLFQGRILGFSAEHAAIYGNICSRAESIGRPISMADAQIAAITLSHRATLATRNIKDFQKSDIALVNPFGGG